MRSARARYIKEKDGASLRIAFGLETPSRVSLPLSFSIYIYLYHHENRINRVQLFFDKRTDCNDAIVYVSPLCFNGISNLYALVFDIVYEKKIVYISEFRFSPMRIPSYYIGRGIHARTKSVSHDQSISTVYRHRQGHHGLYNLALFSISRRPQGWW